MTLQKASGIRGLFLLTLFQGKQLLAFIDYEAFSRTTISANVLSISQVFSGNVIVK